jgi:hypothetical protein
MFDDLEKAAEAELWSAVPQQVRELHAIVRPLAEKVAAVVKRTGYTGAVGYSPVNSQLCLAGGLVKLSDFHDIADTVVTGNEFPDTDLVLLKAADGGYLGPVARGLAAVQKPFGGPNPLTSAIVGGLVGGGLGYGGGTLLESILPEKQFQKGRLRKVMAGIGAGMGATPGAVWGTLKNHDDHENPGQTFEDRGAGWTSAYPFHKEAGRNAVGAMFMPTIPVDAFNRAVWNDVHQTPNLFGTKSQWGDNSQQLSTPPRVAAAASGLVAGAAASRGGNAVSVWDVARAGAIGGGKGLLAGLVGAKVIGAITGLKPEAQKSIWRAGAAAGALTNAMSVVFGN